MTVNSRTLFFFRLSNLLVLYLAFFSVTGCRSWQTVQKPYERLFEEDRSKLRVTVDGSTFVVRTVGIDFDSNTRTNSPEETTRWRYVQEGRKLIKLNLDSVEKVELSVYSPGKTAGLVVGIVVPAVGLLTASFVLIATTRFSFR